MDSNHLAKELPDTGPLEWNDHQFLLDFFAEKHGGSAEDILAEREKISIRPEDEHVRVLRWGNAVLVTTPPLVAANLETFQNEHGLRQLDATQLSETVGHAADLVFPPVWYGYTSTAYARLHSDERVRRLAPGEFHLLDDLKGATSRPHASGIFTEWEQAGIKEENPYIAVAFLKTRIVAAASVTIWQDRIAHIGILTHPHMRGMGFGLGVTADVTRFALEQNLIPQIRTLAVNAGVLAIAAKLGFSRLFETYVAHIIIA